MDSQISLMDQSVQTDPNSIINIVNNYTQFYDYVEKSQQLADFVGMWAMLN